MSTREMKGRAWVDICELNDIEIDTGVCAELNGEQVAIFKVSPDNRLYSISNFDPLAKVNILSRGIVGETEGKRVVFSPLYKHPFCLETGQCTQEESAKVKAYQVRAYENRVQLRLS